MSGSGSEKVAAAAEPDELELGAEMVNDDAEPADGAAEAQARYQRHAEALLKREIEGLLSIVVRLGRPEVEAAAQLQQAQLWLHDLEDPGQRLTFLQVVRDNLLSRIDASVALARQPGWSLLPSLRWPGQERPN